MANQDLTPLNDCIVVKTDFAFDFVNCLITRLWRDEELELQSVQEVQIDNIRSNDEQNEHRFLFGGINAGDRKRTQCFARTASSVLRMCMLRSANVPEDLYPKFGPRSKRRNEARMRYSSIHGQRFVLTTNEQRAREYYSHYDHLHPHFKIEDQLLQIQPNQWEIMPGSMMYIFRGNFSEIITFNTSFQVMYWPNNIGGYYQSFAHVVCQVQKIRNPDHVSVKVLKLMKDGYFSIDVMLNHLCEVNWAEEENTVSEPETDDDENESDDVHAEVEELPLMQPPMPMQPQNLDHQMNPDQYRQPQAPLSKLSTQFAQLNVEEPNHYVNNH